MIGVEVIKEALRVDSADSDSLLKRLIASATTECAKYLGVPASEVDLNNPAIVNGIILIVQADFDGALEKRGDYITAAHGLWAPYCIEFGV